MSWFLFAILAALFWAFGAVLVKRGFQTVPPLWNNIINNFLSLFIYIPAAFFLSSGSMGGIDFSTLPFIAGASLLYQVFYYAISKGKISLTGTIVASYPVFTIILAHIFLSEKLGLVQYLGVILILSGGVLIALPEEEGGEPSGKGSKIEPLLKQGKIVWILWGGFGAISLGTGDFLAKVSVDRGGLFNYLVTIAIVSNIFSAFNFLIDKKNRRLSIIPGFDSKVEVLPTLSGLVLNLVGFVFLLLAFRIGKASLVAPVSSVYPALTVILAIRFLRERINTIHMAGIISIVTGLILIGIS